MNITAADFAKWTEDAQYAFPGNIVAFRDWTLQVLRRGENQMCWAGDIWLIEVTHFVQGAHAPSRGAPCKAVWSRDGDYALKTVVFDDGLEVNFSTEVGVALSRVARSWADAVAEKHFNLARRYVEWDRNRPHPEEKSLAQLDMEAQTRRQHAENDYHERRHRAHLDDIRRSGEAGYLNAYPLW